MSIYYTAPKQEIFDDIKRNAIKIWNTYDNQFGYVDEKLNRIKDLPNVKDNWMYMVAMFDANNQMKLLNTVRVETAALIMEALE